MGVCSRPSSRSAAPGWARSASTDLIGNGTMTPQELAAFLKAAVKARKNIMIAGSTNSGKTTLLRALAERDPAARAPHHRRAGAGAGAGPLRGPAPQRRRVRGAAAQLRGRRRRQHGRAGPPLACGRTRRRVIVGEVLGDEIVTMLNAMSQGNDGSLSTIHANSSMEVFNRIATYALQAEEHLPVEATHMLIAGLDQLRGVPAQGATPTTRAAACAASWSRCARSPASTGGCCPARSSPRAGRRAPCRTPRSSASTTSSQHGYEPPTMARWGMSHGTRTTRWRSLAGAVLGAGLFVAVLAVVRAARADPPASRRCHRRKVGCRAARQRAGGGRRGRAWSCCSRTGWIVVAVVVGLLAAYWDRIAGGVGEEKAGILRLEALATWTESLRDTIAGAIGLEQAIPASARPPPAGDPAVAEPARRPAAHPRAAAGRRCWPSPRTSTTPAPTSSCASLILNRRLRGPGLRDVLSALAVSIREELDMRRRIEASRRSIRRSVRIVLVIVLGVMGPAQRLQQAVRRALRRARRAGRRCSSWRCCSSAGCCGCASWRRRTDRPVPRHASSLDNPTLR